MVCSYVSELSRYFPHGVNGMLAGSATVFFAYIGFDTVASTAEEVRKTPSAKDVHFFWKSLCLPPFDSFRLGIHREIFHWESE